MIYVSFFLMQFPLLTELAKGSGVAAIITVSASVAVILPLSLTVAASASQFSAALADSVGNEGLLGDITHQKVDSRHAYLIITVVAVAILVTLDVTAAIALASRAFALFYALQCFVAWESA